MVEQAKRTAELHMKETQMKAEAIISEAKSKAKSLQENADHRARQVVEAMEDEVKGLEQDYKMLQNHRDNLVADLKNLANDTLEKAERAQAQRSRFVIEDHVEKARRVSESLKNDEPFEEDEEYVLTSGAQASDESANEARQDAALRSR